MSTEKQGVAPMRFLLVIGAVLLALLTGFALGRAGTDPDTSPMGHTHPPGTAPHEHGVVGTSAPDAGVGGVTLSAAGYTLTPEMTSFRPGEKTNFRFRVIGPDGQPVTRYAVVHDQLMHLIVVRRDLTGYQHLHPSMAPGGVWTVPLTLAGAGSWRAYADFSVLDASEQPVPVTLAVDLVAPGNWTPQSPPPATQVAQVDDYQVNYAGDVRVGVSQPLLFRVTSGGAPVTDLQRYLGAYGHLVMLREGDLAYVHVHPVDESADAGTIRFWLAAPSPGRYRLFLDFQVDDTVRTAEFTVNVP